MYIYIVRDKMKVAINVTHFNGLIYIVKKIPEQTPIDGNMFASLWKKWK